MSSSSSYSLVDICRSSVYKGYFLTPCRLMMTTLATSVTSVLCATALLLPNLMSWVDTASLHMLQEAIVEVV